MRVLITGGTGQLGRALQRELRARGHHVIAPTRAEWDITAPDAHWYLANRYFGATDEVGLPERVVHCAALTDTALCEQRSDLARLVNGTGAENVAYASDTIAAMCFIVSTNELFDGQKPTPYLEDDVPNPLNEYGASKLLGERLAGNTSEFDRIRRVRTSWLYGGGRTDFVAKVLKAAEGGGVLRIVTDEVATPTHIPDLAGGLVRLIELDIAAISAVPGNIYHLTNEGAASRYEWAREILRLAGMDPDRVEPITTQELRATGYDGPRKPPYSVLANTRARALGITLRDWREALADYFQRAQVTARG